MNHVFICTRSIAIHCWVLIPQHNYLQCFTALFFYIRHLANCSCSFRLPRHKTLTISCASCTWFPCAWVSCSRRHWWICCRSLFGPRGGGDLCTCYIPIAVSVMTWPCTIVSLKSKYIICPELIGKNII